MAKKTSQQELDLGFIPSPKLRLSEVEKYLQKTSALGIKPSRQTLINWLEEKRLRGVLVPGFGWLVYKDSFEEFLKSLEKTEDAMAA